LLLCPGSPCDARRIVDTPAPISAPVAPPQETDDTSTEGNETAVVEDQDSSIEGNETTTIDEDTASVGNNTDVNVTTVTEGESDNGLSGNSNFCGATITDAMANCTRELHCPVSPYVFSYIAENVASQFRTSLV
jgi:hypothetical protein